MARHEVPGQEWLKAPPQTDNKPQYVAKRDTFSHGSENANKFSSKNSF